MMEIPFEVQDTITDILETEGGYQCWPEDRGNWLDGKLIGTNRGITPAALARQLERTPTIDDMKNLDDDTARQIYWRDYGIAVRVDELPYRLQGIVFDMGDPPRTLSGGADPPGSDQRGRAKRRTQG